MTIPTPSLVTGAAIRPGAEGWGLHSCIRTVAWGLV